ncbi:NUDIX hydrolase [Clostridium grantii]|uniref:ADP-ribose pyrophosphatase n=1 Tax=Clostridium grantii DSM 8605 TaxID=1121316 RepID=A0A1M5SBD5_9CLOT|nr:NUDIX hydrolase [Clostridium grantii]SHH35824.1 ADP-ribose pyrophosphatase [Clostridium grantii DSM 8605]
MNIVETTIESEVKFEGKIIDLTVKQVLLPNGKQASREIVNHPGGVAILAFKDKDTLLLIEQFRSPIEKIILEIPAGKLEKNEDIELCGRRELEEETGYKANKFTYLGKIVPSPGYTDEYIYLYKAEDLIKGTIGCDEDEFINLKEYRLSEVKEMIKDGEIIDSKTICALMYL